MKRFNTNLISVIFIGLVFSVSASAGEIIKVPLFQCEVDFVSNDQLTQYAPPLRKGNRMIFDVDEINKSKAINFEKDGSSIALLGPLTVASIDKKENELLSLKLISERKEDSAHQLRFDFKLRSGTAGDWFELFILQETTGYDNDLYVNSVAVLNCKEKK